MVSPLSRALHTLFLPGRGISILGGILVAILVLSVVGFPFTWSVNPGLRRAAQQAQLPVVYGLSGQETFRWAAPFLYRSDGIVRGILVLRGADRGNETAIILIHQAAAGTFQGALQLLSKRRNVTGVEAEEFELGDGLVRLTSGSERGVRVFVAVWQTGRGIEVKLLGVTTKTPPAQLVKDVLSSLRPIETR